MRIRGLSWDDWFVVYVYCLSQYCYSYIVPIPFISDISCIWHYLYPPLLQNDLWHSLYYIHSQPPLMNLLFGVMLKLFPMYFPRTIMWLYCVAGLLAVFLLNRALARLGARDWLRVLLCGWLCLFPTFLLYSRWIGSTHLEFCLCCVALYVLAGYPSVEALRFRHAMQLCLPLCLLALIRPQWNLLIFAVMLGIILGMRYRSACKAPYLAGVVTAFMPILLVMVKNYLVFGIFTTTSWAGMNLSEVVAQVAPAGELRRMRTEGEISPYFPVAFNFGRAQLTREDWEKKGRPVPVIDHPSLERMRGNRMNYNYLPFIEAGQQDLADSLAIIRHYPMEYLGEVAAKMKNVAMQPSIGFINCGFSVAAVGYSGRHYYSWPLGIRQAMQAGCLLLYVLVPLAVLALAVWRKGYVRQHRAFIVAGFFLAGSMFTLSCAFNKGEQERMRWGTQPFYIAFLAVMLEAGLRYKAMPRMPDA